jgi:hypothetical protein
MRRLAPALLLALLVGATPVAAPEIPGDRLLAHVKFLASDDMRGRADGSPELERAGDYIREQFKAAGLQPAWSGEWAQPFPLVAGLLIGSGNALSIDSRGTTVRLDLGTSYYPMAASPSEQAGQVSASLDRVPLVFAGYGLSVPGQGSYDDYANIDVAGKAVLVFSHEPQERDQNSRLNGARPMPQTTLQAKAAAARSRGALALLVVSDPVHRTDEGNYRMFALDPDAEDLGLPVLRVRRDEMKGLLETWGLDAVAREIDRDLVPRSRELPGATMRYEERLTINRRTVRNIVGVLPGSDPKRAGESIVIGAHYDHVGIGGRHSAAPERTGEIHNGADDNASGTAAIIEMAREAVRSRSRFPRTLVFVAFAGEEDGLFGSDYYARHAPLPIERTVVMLNLDMVGRSGGSVDISGIETAPSLEADLQAAIKSAPPITVRREGPGAGRSDDFSFIAQRVPAINFFTGFHNDYHRPTDDWDRIDANGAARVAALALELAARIAQREVRPAFVEPKP